MSVVTYLLLVTWFTASGPSSYQVEFSERPQCEQAIAALTAEQTRLQQAAPSAQPAGSASVQVQTGAVVDTARPYVSAVCVER